MWNFYVLSDENENFKVKQCIVKNLTGKKTLDEGDKQQEQAAWTVYFASPGITTLWGFWVSCGRRLRVPLMNYGNVERMPADLMHTQSPMSDFYKMPVNTTWDRANKLVGTIEFVKDMESSLSNWFKCIAAKTCRLQIQDLEREIAYAKSASV